MVTEGRFILDFHTRRHSLSRTQTHTLTRTSKVGLNSMLATRRFAEFLVADRNKRK